MMENTASQANMANTKRRVYLRVPLKVKGEIYSAGKLLREISLEDISSGGLSFYVGETDMLPVDLEIKFCLPGTSRFIRSRIAVQSRVSSSGGVRIGCSFPVISEEDKGLITKYICKFTDFSPLLRLMPFVGFLCFMDALCRFSAMFVCYFGLRFEKIASLPGWFYLQFSVILLYLSFTASSFILAGRPACRQDEKKFSLAFKFMMLAGAFMVYKAIGYILFWFAHPRYLAVDIFVWSYTVFALFTAVSVLIVARSQGALDKALNVLVRHRTYVGPKEGKA